MHGSYKHLFYSTLRLDLPVLKLISLDSCPYQVDNPPAVPFSFGIVALLCDLRLLASDQATRSPSTEVHPGVVDCLRPRAMRTLNA